MKILDARFMVLQYLLNAYDKISVPLIGYDGTRFLPMSGTAQSWTGCFDDIGIYVLIPKLVRLLDVSLQQGIDIFFYSLQYVPFLLAFIGFFLLYTSWMARFACAGSLAFLLYSITNVPITDVYLAYSAAPLSVIPLFLYFLKNKFYKALLCFIVLSGIVLGFLHYVRSYAGLCVVGFMVIILLCNDVFNIRRTALLLTTLFISLLIPYGYFSYLVHEYTTYSSEHFDACDVTSCHAFWTTLYAGFGFLKYLNIDNISFEDSFVVDKIQQKEPNLSFLQMPEFEKAVKQEVIDLFIHQRFFVIVTLFAKLGVLFFYLLKYANLGLLALFFVRIAWWQELAWFFCLGLSALFPLMTLPQGNYTLSFIACCTLFGIVNLGNLLENFSVGIFLRRIFYKTLRTAALS